MWTKKHSCSICNNKFDKSILMKYVTVDERILYCCEKCISYVKTKK
jgi:ribosomal protein L24E